jgi:hypothetical protein
MYFQENNFSLQEFRGVIHAHRICYVAFLVVFAVFKTPAAFRTTDTQRTRWRERTWRRASRWKVSRVRAI